MRNIDLIFSWIDYILILCDDATPLGTNWLLFILWIIAKIDALDVWRKMRIKLHADSQQHECKHLSIIVGSAKFYVNSAGLQNIIILLAWRNFTRCLRDHVDTFNVTTLFSTIFINLKLIIFVNLLYRKILHIEN